MSVDVSVHIDRADLAAFQRGMDMLRTGTPRSMRTVVKMAGLTLLRSMIARSKDRKAPAYARDVVPNPDRVKGSRGRPAVGAKWAIVVRKQNQPDRHIKTNSKKDRRRRVANMGFAESMFRVAQGRIGGRGGSVRHRKARRWQRVSVALRGDNPEIRFSSTLSYVNERWPRLVTESLGAAGRDMQRRANEAVEKSLQKAARA